MAHLAQRGVRPPRPPPRGVIGGLARIGGRAGGRTLATTTWPGKTVPIPTPTLCRLGNPSGQKQERAHGWRCKAFSVVVATLASTTPRKAPTGRLVALRGTQHWYATNCTKTQQVVVLTFADLRKPEKDGGRMERERIVATKYPLFLSADGWSWFVTQ